MSSFASTPSGTFPPLGPLASFVETAASAGKGRILKTKRAFKAGSTVFFDTPLVSASWHQHECIECATDPSVGNQIRPHSSGRCPRLATLGYYPPKLIANIENVEAAVCMLVHPQLLDEDSMDVDDDDEDGPDAMEVLDKARCLIKCILWCSQTAGERRQKVLSAMRNLTVANPERDLEIASKLRQVPLLTSSGLLPKRPTSSLHLTDADLGQILGALNTNSHMLDRGGSALFLVGAMMESNCYPNCSFFTAKRGSRLSVIALRDLQVGEPVSIDYGNNYYRPTLERRQELSSSYGFQCDCESCTVLPDLCRAFTCPRSECSGGVVHPKGDGAAAGSWACAKCNTVLSEQEQANFQNAEEMITGQGFLNSEEAADAAVAQFGLHPTHYLIFWCLNALGEMAIEEIDQGLEPGEARRIWKRVINLAEIVIPNHPELHLMFDKLAQVECLARDFGAAKAAWNRSYELACTSADIIARKHIKRLRDNPPTTASKLQAIYAEQEMDR
jgi:hypothetical protein|eukprot:g3573.t1